MRAAPRHCLVLVGDDADVDTPRHCIIEPGRRSAAADIELTPGKQRDHLGGRIEHHEIGVDALGPEEALLVSGIEPDIRRRAGDANTHRVQTLRKSVSAWTCEQRGQK